MSVVIFDLDGTLCDTLGDLHNAVDRVLVDAGRSRLERGHVRRFVGLGGRTLLRLAWAATGAPASDEEIEAAFPKFLAYYREDMTRETTLFPGCVAALDALGGHALAVATNKPAGPADAILRALGVRERFAMVLGGDSLPTCKPDPAMIHAIRAAHPGPAVMVGDSGTDAKAAANAGIPMVFCRWGYPGPDGLPPPTDLDVEGFDEVPAAVERALRR